MLFGICLILEINTKETDRLTDLTVSAVFTRPPEETINNSSKLEKECNCITTPQYVSPHESNFKPSTGILNEMPDVIENVHSEVENGDKSGIDKTLNTVDNMKKNKEDADVTSTNEVVYNLTKVGNADPHNESYSKPGTGILKKIADVVGKVSEETENNTFLIDEVLKNSTNNSEVTSIYEGITRLFEWLSFK